MLKKAIFLSIFAFAFVASASAAINPVTPSKDTDGCYAIGTAAELYWFSDYVNKGEMNSNLSCAKLIKDIVVNENVLKEDGTLNGDGSNFEVWKPIGDSLNGKPFMGSFDGQGHVISGLYYADGRYGNLLDNDISIGLFGYVLPAAKNVVIQNLNIVDSYFQNCANVGGIIGHVSLGSYNVEIRKCSFDGTIASRYRSGGLVGYYVSTSSTLFVENSYTAGHCYLLGYEDNPVHFVGGLLGVMDRGARLSVVNSFSSMTFDYEYADKISQSDHLVGALLSGYGYSVYTPKMENVFYLESEKGGCAFHDGLTQAYGIAKSVIEFTDGSVAKLLQDYSSEGVDGSVWVQDIADGDSHPRFKKETSSVIEKTVTYKLSDGTEVVDSYIVGLTRDLPNVVNGKKIKKWSTDAEGLSIAYAIPTTAAENLVFYGFVPSIKLVDGCYEINNEEELYDFSEIVEDNSGNLICGKLKQNIVVNTNVLTKDLYLNGEIGDYRLWSPIGSEEAPFNGTFDGQGHTISGLVSADVVAGGLFGFVTGTSIIKNVGVEDSYLSGMSHAGGIVACVFGYYGSGFTLTNSYSISYVRVTGDGPAAGGLVGQLGAESYLIANTYHIGNVYGARNNGCIIGKGSTANIYNTFHDESFTYDLHTRSLNDDFKKGTVASLLHNYNENSVDGSIWGQDPTNGDWHPNFSGTVVVPKSKIVYRLSDGSIIESTYEEGIDFVLPSEVDGKNIKAWVKETDFGYEGISTIYGYQSGDLEVYGLISSIKSVDGCYEITNGSELYEFAYTVSSESAACGKLTKDIFINENVLNADGSLNSENTKLRQWTPIGSWGNPFKGTFDGQGHSISGLYFKMETVEQYGSNRIGLFGYVESSDNETVSIKNLVVKDSYIWGYEYVGGIIGEARDVHLEVEACGFEGFVNAQNSTAAGIIGFADETRIGSSSIVVQNSYNQGAIKSYDRIGGIIGATSVETTVLSSYNVGKIDGQDKTGEIIGFAKDGAVSMAWNNYFIGTEDDAFGSAKTAEEFADGSVVTILRGSENLVWGQNVADGEKYPNFSGKIKKTKMQTDDDGCYLIASSDDLYEFAKVVDIYGEVFACGKLTADIVVNEDVLDADGNLKNDISTYRLWTPIGIADPESMIPYSGTFDGQGHVVSGLVSDGNNAYGGLFGYVKSNEEAVSIRNVGVENSYIQGVFAGGLVGVAEGKMSLDNVYVASTVAASVGSKFQGMIPESRTAAGGIVAQIQYEGFSINNSFFYGKLTAGMTENFVAMAMPMFDDDTPAPIMTNNFFIGETDDGYGTAKSAEEFANGSVAALLRGSDENSIWGQNVTAGDKYPNFSGSIVKPELVLTWDEASEEVNVADLEIPAEAASIAIEEGKQFYANGKIYEGELTAEDIQDLKAASATLKPISGIALAKDGDGEGVVATLSGSKSTDELVVPEDITVEHIEIARNFTAGRFSTLMLPFSMDLNEDMEDVLQITDVQKEGDQWVATGTRANSIVANTPYLIKFNKNASISVDNVTLKATTGKIMESTSGPWTFRGAYKGKTWVEGDPELGKVYGFAGVNEGDNIVAGQFVKAGVGASVPPMRAYLVYNKPVVSPKPGVGLMKAAANEAEELPKTIVVRIVDDNNEVVDETVIEDVIQGITGDNLNTVDKKPVRWYDLQGRHLNGKPTARGAYIKNNKAIVNK
ncbi:MAG: hypothetical protein MJY93_03925 [Fibrobacter sp.]|nr:hypothetical protein [Fibrobacter sp.]